MTGDLAKLQGTWRIAALEIDGNSMPASGSITIEDERFTTAMMGADYSGVVELDASKRPKRFDLLFTTGPHAGNRSLGIYQLDGDSWKICLGFAGSTRPTSFATTPGSGHALETLVRGAAEESDDEPSAAEAAELPPGADDLSGEWIMVDAMQMGHHLDASMVKTGRRVATHTDTATWFGKQLFMKATYTTDPDAHPKTIDFVHTAGPSKGKTQLGIYELDGGLLRLCFAPPGGPRPDDFEAAAGDGRTFAVWKRATAARAGG
jgi:uncharacterized protein (TIGR03067 family)